MADKTFGVKVSEDLHDKVKNMIDVSGISAKEWFEKAVSLTEINKIKQGATDYKQDLSELEVHTTRIYELISNMVQRSIYIKDHAVKEYIDKLDQKEDIIGEYQTKLRKALESENLANASFEELTKENRDFIKQLEEIRSTNANNQLLIEEYKEKNDTLNGLVSKYQSYAEENEELKVLFSNERTNLRTEIAKKELEMDHQTNKNKDLNKQIEEMKANYIIELERLKEKKDFERERALLETERSFQNKLLKANEEYNKSVKELYDELTNIRKEHEIKVKDMVSEMNSLKNIIDARKKA